MKPDLLNILDLSMPFINAILAGVIGFLFARRKNNSEVRKIDAESELLELRSIKSAVDIWQGIANELKKEVVNLTKEVAALKQENAELKQTIAELKLLIQNKSN